LRTTDGTGQQEYTHLFLTVCQLLVSLTIALTVAGCHSFKSEEKAEPVTISFFGWGPTTTSQLNEDALMFAQFTQKTGIRVQYVPGPESSTETLKTYQQSFKNKPITPDVYLIDVVWPRVLSEHLADLRSSLGEDSKELLDATVKNDTVDGRLVGMPFFVETGVLYYRTDLLAQYGYKHPPETWDELEQMAARIQKGERAAGNPHFWGYVWQGAAYEGLTCDAMEWQMSEGGGRIIEDDGTISVNNLDTVRAMKRARGWVNTISPPGVTEFKEEDSRNAFVTGNAAFRREWIWGTYATGQGASSPIRGKFAATQIPRGRAGHASVIGGRSLAISKYSLHPQEAAEFIRFLISRDAQLRYWNDISLLPARKDFFADRQYLKTRPDLQRLEEVFKNGAVARPSTIAGEKYAEVSQAYFSAVHSVLTGEVSAEKAMADLETELVKITGFKAGKPKPVQSGAGAKP